jgi:hypothetical protein
MSGEALLPRKLSTSSIILNNQFKLVEKKKDKFHPYFNANKKIKRKDQISNFILVCENFSLSILFQIRIKFMIRNAFRIHFQIRQDKKFRIRTGSGTLPTSLHNHTYFISSYIPGYFHKLFSKIFACNKKEGVSKKFYLLF